MLLLGFGNNEIARELGVTPQNVSDIRNSPLAQDQLAVLKAARDSATVDVARALVADAPKSLSLLTDIRDGKASDDIKLRATVAQDLLDRGGFGKVTKIAARVSHGIFTPEVLERIKKRASSDRASNATEADFEEIEEAPDASGDFSNNSVQHLDRVFAQ